MAASFRPDIQGLRAPGIEAPEVEPAGLADLLHEMGRYQPARDDEEDVDAGKAAGERGEAEMVG
ncbi:hypothetical protein, partial [Mesorhizobium sp. M7A.F.Ca.CA.002.15.2.1]|uniref:hypothetical protein n=1 Tax=Mesorhizobium sp. M7A.F.Ca.CA.002.15.2.1 TaxID=2496678 RepID=UPI0019D058E1